MALQADAAKARTKLNWRHRLAFHDLVRIMVDAETAELARRSSGIIERLTDAEHLSR